MAKVYKGYIFKKNFIDSLSRVGKKDYEEIDKKLEIMSQSALKMLKEIQKKEDND